MPIDTPEAISVARAAEQFRQRHIFLFRFGVPDGGFDAGFGHVVAADPRKNIENFGRGREFPALEQRPQKIANDVPGGFDGFIGIVRIFAGGTFAPADARRRRQLRSAEYGAACWCRSWSEMARSAADEFREE